MFTFTLLYFSKPVPRALRSTGAARLSYRHTILSVTGRCRGRNGNVVPTDGRTDTTESIRRHANSSNWTARNDRMRNSTAFRYVRSCVPRNVSVRMRRRTVRRNNGKDADGRPGTVALRVKAFLRASISLERS